MYLSVPYEEVIKTKLNNTNINRPYNESFRKNLISNLLNCVMKHHDNYGPIGNLSSMCVYADYHNVCSRDTEAIKRFKYSEYDGDGQRSAHIERRSDVTLLYCAPEILSTFVCAYNTGCDATEKNDVWSLGIIICEILLGKMIEDIEHDLRLKDGQTIASHKFYNQLYTRMLEMVDDVPPQAHLKELVKGMLQPDIRKRWDMKHCLFVFNSSNYTLVTTLNQ